jgi:hypothetical protein
MSEHQQANGALRTAAHLEPEVKSEFSSADFLSPDSKIEEALSDRIDLYFNQPLELFPYGERNTKPDRFHVLFIRQIEERFPDDATMRRQVGDYGRLIFHWLRGYMLGKRLMQALTLLGLLLLALFGPALFQGAVVGAAAQTAAAAAVMLVLMGVFAGVSALVFNQYRLGLENRSYSLSREIIQYTRTLQNDYTTIRALPDQSETYFQADGAAWGRRSAFLTRLLMWIAARMEHLEKFIQAEMWRVRRERYWMDWAGGFLTVLVLLLWIGALAILPAPAVGGWSLRVLQLLALILGFGVSWMSYFCWRTPVGLVEQKLDPGSWIRYASLDLDNAVAEQVRRDKERLVEYRNLTRSR